MKKYLLLFILLPTVLSLYAQKDEIFDQNITTLQVVARDRWLSMPIIKLNDDEVINIGFDDLTHEYRRLTYTIEHCDADWTVSEALFPSDFIEGFADGNTIDDKIESVNTNVLYTHYSFCIPNERCRIKMGGNYRVTVFDENNGNEKVFVAHFMVLEPRMGIMMEVSSNTDIDINKSHQQVSMKLSYGSMTITEPREQIKSVVLQNGRWNTAVINTPAQYVMANGLQWLHNKDLIFEGGNEYHKFEMLDPDHPSMGVDKILWDGSDYHVYPFGCEPQNNYVYDEDANGAFYIRNSDNYENDRSSEYMYVHYLLRTHRITDGTLYIDGKWTHEQLTPDYQMTYNEESGCYEAVILQKLGYYNYHFVLVNDDGTIRQLPSDGSFYQTKNKYQCLIYYRGPQDRTDILVGFQEVQYKN
ncbi:MAG: DUF5103 domain-containing protein [Prevotella sp.]|nr:DUF5103 domain-containing protein [Prevotella sp.]